MRTNIERAINKLILSNRDVTLANAFPAYLREAGFKKMSADALAAFEHALDKYPMRPDESHAVFAKGISRIAAEYWSSKSVALADVPGRTVCDECARQLLDLVAEAKARGRERPEEKEKAPKRRLKSKKKGRRVRAKRDVVTARFDPYAPSTSTVMLLSSRHFADLCLSVSATLQLSVDIEPVFRLLPGVVNES